MPKIEYDGSSSWKRLYTPVRGMPEMRERKRRSCHKWKTNFLTTYVSSTMSKLNQTPSSVQLWLLCPSKSRSLTFEPVIFNWGSAEPHEHLPGLPHPASKNDLACEITPDSIVEILGIFLFVLICFYVFFCIDLLCWIIFVVSKILAYIFAF